MMKYKEAYWLLVSEILRKPMEKWYGEKFTAVILRRAKPLYREMLAKTADIGADNPMAMNVYMCFPMLAIWKASAGKMRLDDYRKIVEECCGNFVTNPLAQMVMAGFDINTEHGLAAAEDMFHKYADWLKMHPQYADTSWDFHFDKMKHRDGTYYHFTQCPLARFAAENDLLDVLPICCDIDYQTAKLMHAKLHREQTLASGGTMCDYWFIPDKTANPQ